MKKIYCILIVIITIFSINKLYANENTLVVHTYESFISDWGPGPQIEEEFEKVCNCDLQFIGITSEFLFPTLVLTSSGSMGFFSA